MKHLELFTIYINPCLLVADTVGSLVYVDMHTEVRGIEKSVSIK